MAAEGSSLTSHLDPSTRLQKLLRHLDISSPGPVVNVNAAASSGDSDFRDVESFYHENGCFEIVLNRPKQLNTLTVAMLHRLIALIKRVESDAAVRFVLLRGAGDKAFCAGGDLKDVSSAQVDFIRPEYKLDYEIARLNLQKPFVSIWNGFVMGGGVGLSHASRFIVVSEKTVFAMPETKIGFIPDVAASYFLNKLPGSIGMAMALTGERLLGSDLVNTGLATHYVPSQSIEGLLSSLRSSKPFQAATDLRTTLNEILTRHGGPSQHPREPKSDILRRQTQIDQVFGQDALLSLLQSIESEADPHLKALGERIRSYGPTAVSIAFEMMRRMRPRVAACATLTDHLEAHKAALEMEYRIMVRMLKRKDTIEGVVCLLFEKHRKPVFDPPRLEDVTPELVESFFLPLTQEDHPEGELLL